ncbi:hypothetical protein Mmc1_0684 [Magnetococcus marinus MC-1]|uniref:Uncharacterized protein n=1 Tax=Magnetococcus marinus (strain ATCC BAA-1437 / JCM 17883 / MC-1) TaxID=156889 RepID=A0L5G2_MAGMM|nr:hypothetical protein Mmc1_0684 [Magnetococcus marinus MC-1]
MPNAPAGVGSRLGLGGCRCFYPNARLPLHGFYPSARLPLHGFYPNARLPLHGFYPSHHVPNRPPRWRVTSLPLAPYRAPTKSRLS